jgi:hypothetical protein
MSQGTGPAPAAIFVTLVLCFPAAWAQEAPHGYVMSHDGEVIVMRPSVSAEPDVAIRVYPAIDDGDAAGVVVRRWVGAHPLAGVDPRAVRVRNETLSGVSVQVIGLRRFWKEGTKERQELVLMPRAGTGRYQPVVVRMPSQPGELMKHSLAAADIVMQIVSGKFQPKAPAKV